MDEETARFLVSDDGRKLLRQTAVLPGDDTRRVLILRGQGHLSAIASGLVEVASARRRAARRFPDADQLFFAADTLAQASSPDIAAYHAAHLAPLGTIADLGCGAGIDTIALAEAGARVLALERDPARLIFACANAEVCGVSDRITFRAADVTTDAWEADAVFWDPSRRTDVGRVSRHGDRYEPPLSYLETIRDRVRGGCVKLSPALPDDVLSDLNGRVEFLSEGRECKEACLWFGEARGTGSDKPRSAVLLPENLVFASEDIPPAVASELGTFIHDPDPALIRAGALGGLSDVFAVSADDAYLTGGTRLDPKRAGSSYRVWEAMTYRPRDVGRILRARNVGRLVVKKRHFPQEPETIVKELGLSGKGEEATLILVRDGKRFVAVLCEPVP